MDVINMGNAIGGNGMLGMLAEIALYFLMQVAIIGILLFMLHSAENNK